MLRIIHKIFNKTKIPNLNPEFFHNFAMNFSNIMEKNNWILKKIEKATYVKWEEKLKFNIWDIEFKNHIWLAAWFIKEPHWLKFWEAFWFWSMTIWWITRNSQSWNKKKRIFRFSDWIVNWMWLPWPWFDKLVEMSEDRKKRNMMPKIPLWAN